MALPMRMALDNQHLSTLTVTSHPPGVYRKIIYSFKWVSRPRLMAVDQTLVLFSLGIYVLTIASVLRISEQHLGALHVEHRVGNVG
jgi:hypothetical protein